MALEKGSEFSVEHIRSPNFQTGVATNVAVFRTSDGFVHIQFFRDIVLLDAEAGDIIESSEKQSTVRMRQTDSTVAPLRREDVALISLPISGIEKFSDALQRVIDDAKASGA